MNASLPYRQRLESLASGRGGGYLDRTHPIERIVGCTHDMAVIVIAADSISGRCNGCGTTDATLVVAPGAAVLS